MLTMLEGVSTNFSAVMSDATALAEGKTINVDGSIVPAMNNEQRISYLKKENSKLKQRVNTLLKTCDELEAASSGFGHNEYIADNKTAIKNLDNQRKRLPMRFSTV